MENRDSIWTRRNNNTGNISLSTNAGSNEKDPSTTPRDFSSLTRRSGATSSHGRSNPFNSTSSGGGLASPTSTGGAHQFGLGSGAFAAFGSAKTPKASGNPFEQAMGVAGAKTPSTEKSMKDASSTVTIGKPTMGSIPETSTQQTSTPSELPLRDHWVFWFRPPITKAHGYIPYENTLHEKMLVKTVQDFWAAYKHLNRPSTLPLGSEYHLFKHGVRPIWEDDENKSGGKWVLRLKKGIADRYWENLLMGLIGDQFFDESEEICGGVLSMRHSEDVISIWTRITGQRALKIRDHMRVILQCPENTDVDFKTHNSSMQHQVAIEGSRREQTAPGHQYGDKRSSQHHKPRQSHEEPRS